MIFAGTEKSVMKRTAAALTAAVLAAATVTGCASATDYSITAGGKKINAGVYINFILNEMTQQMYTMYYSGEITQLSECLEKQVEGKDFMTYVKDKALDDTKEFAAIQAKFDELGLSLSEDDVKTIESSVSSSWSSQKDYYEFQGVSRESLQMCNELSYKKDTVFDYYYSEGGVEEITNDALQTYVNDNYIRYKAVAIPKSSETDEEAKNKENEELKALYEKYYEEAQSLDFAGMNDLIAEYDTYKQEKAAEKEAAEAAAAESADSTESTDAGELSAENLDGSEQAVDVEVPETNAANEESSESEEVTVSGAETTAPSDAPDETAATTADDTAKPDETDASASSENTDEKKADSSEESAETKAPKEDAPADTTSEETAAAAADDASSGADDSAAETADLEGVLTDGAAEAETDPYANEVMTNYTEAVDSSSEYYSESYAGMLKAIMDTEVGKAGKYENDEYFYVFMRAEVSERTDYVPDHRSTLIHNMKDEEFDGLVKGWIDAASIVVNDKAMKRYTVKEVYDRQEEYSKKQSAR
ncbi:MAG: hypothetical protein K6B74_07115 [Ruminococcus sp.]|nr:hypothetical protein [Ruminococcus sp.]